MLNDGDDGVLLVRPDLRDVNVPYRQSGISLTLNYVRLSGRYQMLNDGDDGVLLVHLGTVVTQMMPY